MGVNADHDGFCDRLCRHLKLSRLPTIDWTKSYSDSGASHWSNYFTAKLKEIFKQRYGARLIEWGYAEGFDW